MRSLIKSARTERAKGHTTGFSLIELLVVVAVILIIASIAIPNFIKSKMRANEAAVQNLRNISTAEVVYSTTYGIGFSDNLVKLTSTSAVVDQNNAGLIDEVLASGTKSGYVYTFAVLSTDSQGHVTGYSVSTDPISAGNTGVRHFYTDQTAVIRFNGTTTAGPGDTPIS